MKKNILLIAIFLIPAYLGFPKTVSAACGAGWFCGIDQGYKATVNIGSKRCFAKNLAFTCSDSGAWTFNRNYDCKTYSLYDPDLRKSVKVTTKINDCTVSIDWGVPTLNASWPNSAPSATDYEYNSCNASGQTCSVSSGYTTTCCVKDTATPTPVPTSTPPVNGACGATHYNCSAGASANNVSGATVWTWNCNGSGGGSNASCSETKACTINSTPTCIAFGTQISTAWNVVSKNFTINQIEGRFNKTPYTDWPTGPGDQSLNWGTGTFGTNVANITGGTDYSTSVAMYDVAPNAARDNYICRSASTNLNCPIPSCTLSLAAIPSTIAIGDASALSATVTPTGGTISKVDFSEAGGHTTPASITDNSSPFSYLATGASSGISTVTAKATMNNGVTTCSGSAIINVTFRGPWWQVKDGDVTTNGNLSSSIPPTAGLYFDLAGAGGYPGVPAYGGVTNLTAGNVSVAKWIANSGYTSTKIFDSNYFLNAISSDAVINNLASSIDQTSIDAGVADPSGVYYFEYDSTKNAGTDLTIASAINIGAKKVIVIAKNSDIYVKGRINLTRGQGFFLLVAGKDAGGIRGNIIIDPSVGGGASANLEGIYVADSQFRTGIAATQLWLRGTVASYGGASLQRDLGAANSTTPAELFEYAPDQELLFPSRLANHAMTWQEVAP